MNDKVCNMKAWVLANVGDIRLRDISIKEPDKDEVIVHVRACGVCGSDIPRIYKTGAHNMPLVIGHEFAGEVAHVAPGSEHLLGKRVGVFPLKPCKKCKMCKRGAYALCEHYDYLGSRSDGGMAEYVKVPIWNLIELPDIPYEVAAMLEPMAVAVHAARRVFTLMEADKSEKIVISGQGTVGMLLGYFLGDIVYTKITVIVNKNIQKRLTAARFVDIREEEALDAINGANVYFEAVGTLESLSTGISALAPHGRLCIIGNPHSDMMLPKDIYWQILRKELAMAGCWNSTYGHDEDDFRMALNAFCSAPERYEKIISHRYDIENLYKGFELMRDKTEDYIKVMMVN